MKQRDRYKQDEALPFFVGLQAVNMKTVPNNRKKNEENNFLLPTHCQYRSFGNDHNEQRENKLQKEVTVTKARKNNNDLNKTR